MVWLVLVIIKLIKQKEQGNCSSCSQRNQCAYSMGKKSCVQRSIVTDHEKEELV